MKKAEIEEAMSSAIGLVTATSLDTGEEVLGLATTEKDRDDFNSWYYEKIGDVKHPKEPFNPLEYLVQQLEQEIELGSEQCQTFTSHHDYEPDSAPGTAGQGGQSGQVAQACQAGQGGQACMGDKAYQSGQSAQACQAGHAGDVDTLGLEKKIQLGVVSLETIIVLIFAAMHLFNKSNTFHLSHQSAFKAVKAAQSPPPSLNKWFSNLSAELWKLGGSIMNMVTSEEANPLGNVDWVWADKNLLRDFSQY